MYYLLFIIYLLLICFVITRVTFIKNAGLSHKIVITLFLIKVAAGLFCGWISEHYYPQGNDYWNMNTHAGEEYQVLIHDPRGFFLNIFNSPYADHYGGFFNSIGSYWKDLANNVIIKVLAICNILTGGNYYINSLFFNFFVFFGHIALFRIFKNMYKGKNWPLILSCFLLPSTLYFTSGLHKDGIIFTMLSLFSFSLYFSLVHKCNRRYILMIAISLLSIILIRSYVFIALIPAAIAMLFAFKTKKILKSFVFVYLAVIGIIILTAFISPVSNPLHIIVNKQRDFLSLPVATSQIDMDTLQPRLSNFVKNFPAALEHIFLRPYVWEFKNPFLILHGIELLLYQLLFIYMLIIVRRSGHINNAFIYYGMLLSLTLLIFIGYIVPNAGSLMRYRSIYLPFLITPILCSINIYINKKHIKL